MFLVKIKRELCKSCGLCIEFCPRGLIELHKDLNRRGVQPASFKGDPEQCTGCGNCAAMCADAVIEIEEADATPVPAAAAKDKDDA